MVMRKGSWQKILGAGCLIVSLLLIPLAAADAAGMFRGNVQSRIYHNAGCRYFNCKNCTMVFKSAGEAQKAGFRACRICKG